MEARARARLGLSALALGSLLVLATARALTPAASGVGTHTQLGLPPCGFLLFFQLPCPACGLTTAFAHLAHGSLEASLAAHPLGLPLFLGTAFVAARSALEALRARPHTSWLGNARALQCACLYSVAMLAVWLVRLVG
jgi:hypothetical protein